ncbi:MAG TPA: glycosyltransferase family 2 protein [Patescibacteria group bacterium]|nr:glycosyltransferase family 2 protein [Patescibacteria group bacterium]
MRISALILAKNEEKAIEKAIKSVSFCDEVVVIDDYSTDKTAEIAQRNGTVVRQRHLTQDFAAQRNFGEGECRGKWILCIDADEYVTDTLAQEIKKTIQQDIFAAYYLKRRDVWWGRELKHGEVGNIQLVRLFKKGAGKWKGNVHEVFETTGKIGKLSNFFFHTPHPTVREFLSEINVYSSLRAQELYQNKKSVSVVEIIAYPFFKFMLNYIFKGGFLDGPPGFVYAFFMSFHSFLVRAKLYMKYH